MKVFRKKNNQIVTFPFITLVWIKITRLTVIRIIHNEKQATKRKL